MKLRCTVADEIHLTEGKVYESLENPGNGPQSSLCYYVTDDADNSRGFYKYKFEVVEEPNMGMWERTKVNKVFDETVMVEPEGTTYQVVFKKGKEVTVVTKVDLQFKYKAAVMDGWPVILVKETGEDGIERVAVTLRVKDIVAIITEK